MRLLYKHSAKLKRFGKGGKYNEDGKWEDGIPDETPCDNLLCSIQPAYNSGYISTNLPEGINAKDVKLIYSHTRLYTGDEQQGIHADVVEFRGVEYEIFEASPWDGAGRIVAWECIGIKKDVLRNDS